MIEQAYAEAVAAIKPFGYALPTSLDVLAILRRRPGLVATRRMVIDRCQILGLPLADS